jgi:hypothetical protein
MEKILIGLHEFDGPFSALAELSNQPGLIAILVESATEFELLGIEEASNLQMHWARVSGKYLVQKFDGIIKIAVCEFPQLSRGERARALREIEDEFQMLAAA